MFVVALREGGGKEGGAAKSCRVAVEPYDVAGETFTEQGNA
jgi:hypothetical protein